MTLQKFVLNELAFPKSSSNGVSTPCLGAFSPVKLLVCVSGLLTPEMCDMGTTLPPP